MTSIRPPAVAIATLTVAWLGAILFIAALGAYAWFFVSIGVPSFPRRPGYRGVAIVWNILLFTLFAAHHSLMARSGAKAWITRVVSPALERTVYVAVASLLLIGMCLLWVRVHGLVYRLGGATAWLGYAVQASGVVMTLAGARVLDVLELAGIRQARPGRCHDPAPAPIRVVWPFTLVRHPIYLGWALIVFGTPTMTVDRLVWAVVSTAYLVIAIPWEERSLSAAAGPAYSAYQKQVRWRLVPGVY